MMVEKNLLLFPELDSPLPDENGSEISRERLPTNTTTHRHPIHRWFSFIAGFSPEFVILCIENVAAGPDTLLLDPFAGCATASLAAAHRGVRSIGYEPHPVFARMARAKLPSSDAAKRADRICKRVLAGFKSPRDISILPDAPARFLAKLFSSDSLERLLGARESLRNAHLCDDDLAFLMLSSIVEKSSHSSTDGIYKAPTTTKSATAPECAARQVAQMVTADLAALKCRSLQECARIHERSSETMAEVMSQSVDIIVTSPPYLNNFDFAEMTRMLLYFWGIANSWGEITDKVRSKLIVNTTTALKGHKQKQDRYRSNLSASVQSGLEDLVRQLAEQRRVRAGKKEYDYLVYPYFSQLTDVLRECYRCLKPNAPIHMMVADAALYGVHISTPQFLVRILEEVGFRNTRCSLVRRRGHRWILDKRDGSKQGLGEYHIEGVR